MLIFLTFLGWLLAILLLGKREPADLALPKVSIDTSVDHYLEKQEKEVLGLQPGVGKEVVWAERREKKTKFSIIFLHGFTASKFELSPFPNAIALGLSANIYNARLSGHGCGGEALGKVKVKDWVFDLSEALDIGKKKHSLVYYLSVGDQNCGEPGILKLYEPSENILPCDGMITIIPAARKHSAVYGGKTDRVMIGVNFYSL